MFGIDEQGFFIETDAAAPELSIQNLDLVGTVEAAGRLGFLEVSLTDGVIALNNEVSFTVDLVDPEVDPLTDELPGKLRIHELGLTSVLDTIVLDVRGSPTEDDLLFSGTFGVAALIPGITDAPFTIAEAGIVFTWSDITSLLDVTLTPGFWDDLNGNGQLDGTDANNDGTLQPDESDELTQSTGGELIAEFLDLDLEAILLNLLSEVDKLGDEILGVSAFDTTLPLVDSSVNDLITGPSSPGVGDLLKLHDAVEAYFVAEDLPTLSGLLDVVIEDTASKIEGSGLNAELTNEDGRPELRINVDFAIAPEFSVDLELGGALTDVGLEATASATVNGSIDLNLDFAFGLDLTELVTTGSLGNAAFVEVTNLSTGATLQVVDLDLDLDLAGFLQAAIEGGAALATADAQLILNDPTPGDGRTTIDDLTSNPFSTLFDIEFGDLVVQLGAERDECFCRCRWRNGG